MHSQIVHKNMLPSKARSHIGQEQGRSPVWILMWRSKLLQCEKVLSHSEQQNRRSAAGVFIVANSTFNTLLRKNTFPKEARIQTFKVLIAYAGIIPSTLQATSKAW